MTRIFQVFSIRRSLQAFTVLLAISGAVPIAQASSITSISVEDAADRILRERGYVRVVLLYRSTCPACRGMLPEFVKLAEHYSSRGVSILAFSTDEDPRNLEHYLGNNRLPFSRLHLKSWRRGELSAAMKQAGIEIGQTFGVPLIAVLDCAGYLVGQHSGGRGATMAKEWLDSLDLN